MTTPRRLIWLEQPDIAALQEIVSNAPNEGKAWAQSLLDKEDHSPELDRARQSHDQVTSEFAALLQEHDTAITALATAEKRIGELTTAMVSLTTQIGGGSATRRQKMTDPPKYKGNREALRPFKLQLRLKLGESKAFEDEQAKLRYLIGLLEGPALDQLLPYVKADGVDLENAEAAITILERAFGDPDPKYTARMALAKLRQGANDFPTYYAEFCRHAAVLDYGETTKMDKLEDGLCYELRDALISYPAAMPDNFEERVSIYQRVDARIRAQKARKALQPPRNPSTTSRPTGYTTLATTPTTTTAPKAPAPTAHPTSSNSGHYGPAPMDLSAGRRRTLDPEERLRRIREGLCTYCGKPGHFASECHALERSKAIRAAAARAVPAPTAEELEPAEEPKNL